MWHYGHLKVTKIFRKTIFEALFEHVYQVIELRKLHHWKDQLKYYKCTKNSFGDFYSLRTVNFLIFALFYIFGGRFIAIIII